MSTDRVKYPEQPHYHATVSQEDALLVERKNPHNCAKCVLGTMSLVFVLVGIAMTCLASTIFAIAKIDGSDDYPSLLMSWSFGSVVSLLVIGLALIVISVIVWVSSCKPTNCCSKVILFIFSIVMLCVFIVELALLFLGLDWYRVIDISNITDAINITDIDRDFNETIAYLQNQCCNGNGTDTGGDICHHILVAADQVEDCASYNAFYTAVVNFLKPLLTAVAVFLGVVAFFNLVAFVCSCCLLCAKKTAVYKASSPYFKPPADNAA